MKMRDFISLFLIIDTIAGLRKDRYVIRENNPVELDCNHELGNVTRFRWEYVPANVIGNETIYDSQYGKTIKTGFNVSYETHQTFISKCSLILFRAQNENSGKYICYVAEGIAASNSLKTITEIELVIRGPTYTTMVVTKGESVILPCEHNIKKLTRARWSHVSTRGVLTYQLYYMNGKKAYYEGYEGHCEPHSLSCNLKILEANKESAGKYICMVGESQEFEEKYGMFQMTYFIEIQLVVGDLTCNDRMTKDLTLIGENDCYGIEADVLNLKCSFNYFGNISYNLLHLRWIEKYKFNSLEKKLNSSLINHEVKDETKKISIQTNLSVAYEMQNSIFQCILDDTQVKPCQLQEFRIQYMKNTTERSPPIYSNDLHNIKCSANKSENVHCSYYWVHEIGGAMVQNPNAILPVENMNSPGNYTCIAKCHLSNRIECTIKAMEFEVIQDLLKPCQSNSTETWISVLNMIIIILLIPYIVRLYWFLKKRYLKITMKKRRKFDGDNKKESQRLMQDQCLDETEPQHFLHSRTNSVIKRHTSDTSEKKLVKAKSSFPLPVIEILASTSKYADVVIYEAKHPFHKKVLMIDDVMWDTSCDMTSRLERIIHGLLHCHKNPKKVLIFGSCEGRIVKTLLQRGIESINVYETVFDDVKEQYNLYHKYFPKMACHLNNEKVHKLSGDINFLKNEQNAFDVIITRVPASPRSPFDYLLSHKYLESVESALKEGGIYLLIVSGEDFDFKNPENLVMHNIKYLCKNIFPAVKYFQIHYASFSDNPSCHIKCLMCSPDKEPFEELFGEAFKDWPYKHQWT